MRTQTDVRRPWKRSIVLALLSVVATLASAGSAGAARGGTTLDLGTLGGNYSTAVAVNDSRQVVGYSYTESNQFHSFVWADDAMTDLGSLGGTYTVATAINNRGEIVGFSLTETGLPRAFLWEDGVMHDLGTLGGSYAFANDINDQGQVVGASRTGTGAMHAFRWQAGQMTDLGTLGGSVSGAHAINERGQVVGSSLTASVRPHAFLWDNGVIRDLTGSLGDEGSSGDYINSRGQVAGYFSDSRGVRAFFWDGEMVDIGTLGGTSTEVRGLSPRGSVVGASATASGDAHAFLWRDGVMHDLGGNAALAINRHDEVVLRASSSTFLWDRGRLTPIASLGGWITGLAINSHGDIAGDAATSSGETHAFLWKR